MLYAVYTGREIKDFLALKQFFHSIFIELSQFEVISRCIIHIFKRTIAFLMASDQSLTLQTKTTMRLSAQQLRFVRLLEYNTPELEDAVDKELEENPALNIAEKEMTAEEEEKGYRPFFRRNIGSENIPDFTPPDLDESLSEILITQLSERNLPEGVKTAARYIIGNLDSNGYLQRPLQGIVNDITFRDNEIVTADDAVEALKIVQSLEPYGVGATDLRECLLIQLRHLPESESKEDAIKIVDTQFDALSKKHIHRIMSSLKINKDRATKAIDLILGLNPKPGSEFGGNNDRSNVIVPDLMLTLEDDEISISLPNNIPELVIDRTFSEAVAEMETVKKKNRPRGSEFIMSRYNDAKEFIRILRQRQETLMGVMTAIVKIQHDYFLTQDVYKLKPMMIKDVSALTGFDFSVISRATNNKYVSTPWGVFPLRFFFSDSIGEENDANGSEVLTNRKIEAEISDIVNKEDKKHPLSDEKIREEMEKRGYDVSRRTIAKYRDRKNIPVARLRKQI